MIPKSSRPNARRTAAVLAAALVATLAFVLLPASDARAQEPRELLEERTLDNGLDVIVIEDPSLPIVTVEVAVKNGAFTEPADYNGLSHLYEHMFFKGNAIIPDQEAYLERMRELGIVFNGTTSSERVNYFFTLPADNFEPGMEFMYNAITSPKFDEDEFAREKQVVIGEIDRNESNPHYWFRRAMADQLWGEHTSRKDPLGDRETVTNATVEQMRTMKQRYYVPNNSTLLIAGDVEAERAFEIAEQMYGDWERGPEPFEKWPVPEHEPLEERSFVVVERDIEVPYVQFSWHGPSVDEDPEATYAADVLSFILSQPTSRFQKNLVDSGLTLNAGVSYYTQRYTGPIDVSAQVTPDKLEDSIRALFQEVQRLQDPDYYTDGQLEAAKTILAVRDVYDREKVSSLAHTVSFWWAVAGLDYYLDYIPSLQAVTREDIARYVSEYVIDEPYVMGALLSSEHAEQLGMSEEKLSELVRKVEEEVGEEPETIDEARQSEEDNEG
ncbi:MAG: M16 family metallopeptidase [Persicimonas sp.]